MRGRKSEVVIQLTVAERAELEKLVRSRSVAGGLQRRCQAVLAIADGLTFTQAMERVKMSDKHLRNWCRRYLAEGLKGLQDRPGRGRKPGFSPRGCRANRQTRLRAA